GRPAFAAGPFREGGDRLTVSVHFSHTCFAATEHDLFSPFDLQMGEGEMADEHRAWKRQGEAFWRAHHEAWKRSDLNQRQYCEVHGLPRKGFENWRAKFNAEPQVPERKLLYRRGGLSHRLSHTLGHSLSHMTNDALSRPIVP